MPFRSAYNENAELDSAGAEPGAGGFGFLLTGFKNWAGGKEIHARASEIGFRLHFKLGFSLFGGRQCTPSGQIFDKTDMPNGPGARWLPLNNYS